MEEFILKYSNVPKKFIKEFFDLNCGYRCGEKYIDIDVIAKWLKHDADKIKETVIDKFECEIDYITIDDDPKNSFKISTNIFKELCMILGSDKSKQLRKYYMSVEKIINNYDSHSRSNNVEIKKEIEKSDNNAEYIFNCTLSIIYVIVMIIYIYMQFKK